LIYVTPSAEAAAFTSLRIEPPSVREEIALGTNPSIRFRALGVRADGGGEVDVTGSATWKVEGAPLGDVSSPGSLVAAGIGGRGKITASIGGAFAAAPVTLKLTGEVLGAENRDYIHAAFSGALDPALAVPIEYPPPGVILPGNLPPIEFQWGQVGTDTIYRVRFTSSDVLDLTVVTRQRELAVSPDVWSKLGASTADEPTTVAVEATGPSSKRHLSAPQIMTITADRLEQSAIYTHVQKGATSGPEVRGALDLLDVVRGVQIALPTTNTDNSEKCAGCHVVSRDGRRIGFGRPPNQLGHGPTLGTLRYDESRRTYAEAITPSTDVFVGSTTFNTVEATTRPAMLATIANATPETASLALLDPDTGATVPSDLAQMLAAVPSRLGRGATWPWWSSQGALVAFSAYTVDKFPGMMAGNAINRGSLIEASVSFDGNAFHFGAPRVLLESQSEDDSYDHVTYNSDDSAIAYTHFMAKTGVSAEVIRRSDGHVFAIQGGLSSGKGAWNTRSPDWAPTMGARYTWIVMSSSRPYGHRVPGPLFQLWICAIDRAKLASGFEDPSAPAFWAPGQTLTATYGRPQWPRVALPLQ
jgi:hypothetical protein